MSDPATTIDFWDREYRAGRSLHRWPDESLVSFAVRTLKPDPAMHRVLDVGCGSGRHLMLMARLGFQVEGIEPSRTARDVAREWIASEGLQKSASVRDGDVRSLGLEDGAYGCVIAWHVFNNLESESDLGSALTEIHRVLRPGGRLVCTLTSPEDCNFHVSEEAETPGVRRITRGTNAGLPMRFWTRDQARALLESGGFEVERLGSYSRTVDFDPDQLIAGWLLSGVKR